MSTQKKPQDAVSVEREKTTAAQEKLAKLAQKHAVLSRRYDNLDDAVAENDSE